jgi:hypothetical protein
LKTVLKQFYRLVHPDLFGGFSEEKVTHKKQTNKQTINQSKNEKLCECNNEQWNASLPFILCLGTKRKITAKLHELVKFVSRYKTDTNN